MLTWLSMCVAAARIHGIDILDGVYNDIGNADGFAKECAQGLELGFDGKTLIHPSQIEPCNTAFSPSPADQKGAVTIDKLLGKLHDLTIGKNKAGSTQSRRACRWQPAERSGVPDA